MATSSLLSNPTICSTKKCIPLYLQIHPAFWIMGTTVLVYLMLPCHAHPCDAVLLTLSHSLSKGYISSKKDVVSMCRRKYLGYWLWCPMGLAPDIKRALVAVKRGMRHMWLSPNRFWHILPILVVHASVAPSQVGACGNISKKWIRHLPREATRLHHSKSLSFTATESSIRTTNNFQRVFCS